MSGQEVHVGDYCCLFELAEDRLVRMQEAPLVAEHCRLSQSEASGFRFADAPALLGRIAFFSPEYYEGTNLNIIRCPTAMDASNCYQSIATVFAKYCGFGTWPRSSDHCFGYHTCLSSKYSINCYLSVGLNRCFEMDNCRDCSDCLFCHNAENCHDCTFCFNAKSKRYAIGNAEYPKEEYLRIKKMVLSELAGRLSRERRLPWDIFSIGAQAGKK